MRTRCRSFILVAWASGQCNFSARNRGPDANATSIKAPGSHEIKKKAFTLKWRPIHLLRHKFRDGTVRRFLFITAVAFWLGGFTFYGSVVIPSGMKVLGGHVKQGFITQEVTGWLNISAAVALPILLWNTLAIWSARERWARWTLTATWIVMAMVQVELFMLHPALDRLLDPQAREVLDYEHFDMLHRIYLVSSTAQWAAGLLHVWCAVAGREM